MAAEHLQAGVADEGLGRQVEEPGSDDAASPPDLGDVPHVDLVLVVVGVVKGGRLCIHVLLDEPGRRRSAAAVGPVCAALSTLGAMLRKMGSRCSTTFLSPPIIRQKPRCRPRTPPLVPQST